MTAAAGVNLAAANYYFGSKERLYSEVIDQRVRPLNGHLLAQLSQITADAVDQPPALHQILATLVRPVLEVHADETKGGPAVVHLLTRCQAEPPRAFLSREQADDFQVTLNRFAQAIRRHVPLLPPDEFLWRFTFVVGALQHSLINLHQMSALTRGICRNDDHDRFLARFVNFAARVFTTNTV